MYNRYCINLLQSSSFASLCQLAATFFNCNITTTTLQQSASQLHQHHTSATTRNLELRKKWKKVSQGNKIIKDRRELFHSILQKMTFNGGGKPYPSILTVNPTMNIKNILSILSHKIGISPHQFSVFIADKRTNRKIPFTAYLNLATVSRDGGAEYIYIRRYRRFKKKKNISEKLMHLRRDGVVDGKKINGSRSAYPAASSVFDGAESERRDERL